METGRDVTQEQSAGAWLASLESIMSQKVKKKKGRKEKMKEGKFFKKK